MVVLLWDVLKRFGIDILKKDPSKGNFHNQRNQRTPFGERSKHLFPILRHALRIMTNTAGNTSKRGAEASSCEVRMNVDNSNGKERQETKNIQQ